MAGCRNIRLRAVSLLNIEENKPLGPLTTLKVGGPARFFVQVRTEQQVIEAVRFADDRGVELFVLGGGSNILVSDSGFSGLVMKIGLAGIAAEGEDRPQIREIGDRSETTVTLTARAGEDWDGFVKTCVERDLAGVECLSGIPGSVGATPVQNVGAYGQEVSETITRVRCLDLKSGEIVDLTNEACGFAYRTSIFNTTSRGRYIVLSVRFRLCEGGEPRIDYKDLKASFEGRRPSLAEVRDEVIRIRGAKSMVIDTADPNFRSAGSFFKNPVVPADTLDRISAAAGNPEVPRFPAGEGMVKLSAAWLIERAGFNKGFRLGRAGISTNHSLALINTGGASAAEIVALKELIQAGVEAKFGIMLVPEPVFVGF